MARINVQQLGIKQIVRVRRIRHIPVIDLDADEVVTTATVTTSPFIPRPFILQMAERIVSQLEKNNRKPWWQFWK